MSKLLTYCVGFTYYCQIVHTTLRKGGLSKQQAENATLYCALHQLECIYAIHKEIAGRIGDTKLAIVETPEQVIFFIENTALDCIMSGFSWGYTPEGYEYWDTIAHKLAKQHE